MIDDQFEKIRAEIASYLRQRQIQKLSLLGKRRVFGLKLAAFRGTIKVGLI